MNSASSSVSDFYDALANDYHLIFADWEASVRRQGELIAGWIDDHFGPAITPRTVLDCACGIGTQTLGLALRGDYRLTATDISAAELNRAQREAQRLNVVERIGFGIADIRALTAQVPGEFDAVMAFDNALPHLLTDADLWQAARELRAKTRRGGLLLASIRDYDALIHERPTFTSERVMNTPEGKRVTFQVWDWAGDQYKLTQFILTQHEQTWLTLHFSTHYRALQRATLSQALADAGFSSVRWLLPDESGYYQPVVLAT